MSSTSAAIARSRSDFNPSRSMPAALTASSWQGASSHLAAFERVARGAILVDRHARVMEFNAYVRFGDGLNVSGGILHTARAADRDRLHRFLAEVTSLAGRSSSALMTLTLPRPSGLWPWLIDGFGCDTANESMAALLLITDVERPGRLNSELLAELFGFTATEAKLASELASGRSLLDVSAQLDITEGHARQRLKAIFDKTGTSRQGELIALLAKLN